jgi:hypothetical protein
MGAFNLWGWQLWWLIGLWLGVRWSKADLQLERWARKLTAPAVAVFVFFLALRYVQLEKNLDFGRLWPLFDKWNFGLVRLVDFTAVSLLVVRLRSFFKPLAIRPLVMLGQASLPVFCVHLLLVFSALTFMGSNSGVYGWRAVVLVVGSLSALLVTAIVVVKRRQRLAGSGAHVVQLKIQAPRAT